MPGTWNRCKVCRRRSERASTHDDGLCIVCEEDDRLTLFLQPLQLSSIEAIPSKLALDSWSQFYRFCYGVSPSPERLARAKENLGKGWDEDEDDS